MADNRPRYGPDSSRRYGFEGAVVVMLRDRLYPRTHAKQWRLQRVSEIFLTELSWRITEKYVLEIQEHQRTQRGLRSRTSHARFSFLAMVRSK